jgi:hypothetical protein
MAIIHEIPQTMTKRGELIAIAVASETRAIRGGLLVWLAAYLALVLRSASRLDLLSHDRHNSCTTVTAA